MDPRSQSVSRGRILFWLLGGLVVVAFVFWTVTRPTQSGRLKNNELNKKIENASILNFKGEKVQLLNEIDRLHAGKRVILSFWATWCEPCVAEIADFEKSSEQMNRENLAVLLVNIDGGSPGLVVPEVRAWMISQKFKFETYFDFDDAMIKQFKFDGIPFSVGLDKDLRLRWTRMGPLDLRDLNFAFGD